jgi:hypothetical protein
MNPDNTVIVNYNTSQHVKLFLIFFPPGSHPHEDKGLSWPVGANLISLDREFGGLPARRTAKSSASRHPVSNPPPPSQAAGLPRGINTPMRHARDLTDEQWKILAPLIP